MQPGRQTHQYDTGNDADSQRRRAPAANDRGRRVILRGNAKSEFAHGFTPPCGRNALGLVVEVEGILIPFSSVIGALSLGTSAAGTSAICAFWLRCSARLSPPLAQRSAGFT